MRIAAGAIRFAPRTTLVGGAVGAGEHRRLAKRAGLLRGDHVGFEIDAQRLCDASAGGRVGLGAVGDMTLLNVLGRAADLASRVIEQRLLLGRSHLAKKVARLLVVIVVDTMVPMCGRAFELQRRLVKLRLVDPLPPAIGEGGGRSTSGAVSSGCPVADRKSTRLNSSHQVISYAVFC